MPNLSLAALLASLVLAQANTIQPGAPTITIPHGTKIQCTLAGPVNTADLQPNFPLIFNVVAPYPDGNVAFKGAQITAFVTQVQHGSAKSRAGVGFIFDRIIFANNMKEVIYATVDGPNVKRIDQPAPVPPSAPAPFPGPTMMANNNPFSQSPLWEMNLTSQPFPGQGSGQSGRTAIGGFAHARKNGTDVTVPDGAPVTLVLAKDLKAPAH